MSDIYEYIDYRTFLKDYYLERKKVAGRKFSYETFSRASGIKSKGFVHNVIKGTKHISRANAWNFSKAMKLGKQETDYFVALVELTQAVSLDEKNQLHDRLDTLRKKRIRQGWKPKAITQDQFELFAKYHHSVVRSLIDMGAFDGDFKKLAGLVKPRITVAQAKQSVALLMRLGLLEKRGNAYHLTAKTLATPKEVMSLALQNFHLQTGELALKAISQLPINERNVSGMTLGISKATTERICEKIYALHSEILQMAEEDAEADRVYRLNFQLFPVSEPYKKDPRT